jgi:peptidoglycan-N-acetylglucosamine deacetylase
MNQLKSNRYCLITNDVETTSIVNHRLSDNTGKLVFEQGMPRLIELYSEFNIQTTFYFTAHIARLFPEMVKKAGESGHEIGSHGLTHEPDMAFDVLDPKQQKYHLSESKKILEDIWGHEVISFRAPAARVTQGIPEILEECGYKTDSSVSSQRMDMFLSFGSLKKLNWLYTPRKPYFTAKKNIFRKGDSGILEIPISAFIFPYIGSMLRYSATLTKLTRNILHMETLLSGRPFVFLTHPNEFIDEEMEIVEIQRRGKNFISFLLADVVRHKIKLSNLGEKALPLLHNELSFFQRNNYKFVTSKELISIINADKRSS